MGGDHEGNGKGRVRQRSHLGFFPVAFRVCHRRMIALLLVTALHTTTGRLLANLCQFVAVHVDLRSFTSTPGTKLMM